MEDSRRLHKLCGVEILLALVVRLVAGDVAISKGGKLGLGRVDAGVVVHFEGG